MGAPIPHPNCAKLMAGRGCAKQSVSDTGQVFIDFWPLFCIKMDRKETPASYQTPV